MTFYFSFVKVVKILNKEFNYPLENFMTWFYCFIRRIFIYDFILILFQLEKVK